MHGNTERVTCRERLLTGLAICFAALQFVGCGQPAELQAAPRVFTYSTRLGDERQGLPPASTRVSLRSSKPEESLGWTLSGAPAWIQLSAVQGGTPAELDLTFELTSMAFGVNTATLELRQGEARQDLQVRYELLGALQVGPAQSVSLRGIVGEERSSVVRLSLESPVKPGLQWRARTDDPWLVVEPASGTTPSTVTVTGLLARAAPNSSGRIEFSADAAWQGSPAVLPVVIEILNPGPIKKQVEARLLLMGAELEDAQKALSEIEGSWRARAGVDTVLQAIRRHAERSATAATRMATMQQDLLGFLEQNDVYASVAGFSEARASAAARVAAASGAAARSKAREQGIQEGRFVVRSDAEWQRAEVAVRAGDWITFEATGTWTVGFNLSGVGPGGLGTKEYDAYSFDARHNHGCLLLRTGASTLAGGATRGLFKASADGVLEGRCNDTDYRNNSGSVHVRFAVVPGQP